MTDLGAISVRAASVDDEPGILAVLSEAFDRPLSDEWFAWKHREGPWGPSRGWVAVADDEVVGVRLFVPWMLATPTGPVAIGRAMDGAVAPKAQRRGIFSRLVQAEMEYQQVDPTWPVLYSTSVPASRDAYLKAGWSVFSVAGEMGPLRPGRRAAAGLDWDILGDDTVARDVAPATPSGRPIAATAWTVEALRWRTDPRSGHDYRSVRLADSDHPHGAIVRRTSSQGLATLVVVHAWGPTAEQAAVVDAAGRALGARAWLRIAPPAGTPRRGWGRLARRRDVSTVSVWSAAPDPTTAIGFDPLTAGGWAFSHADLEGTM